MVHLLAVRLAEAAVERLGLLKHGVDQLDAALEVFALGFHGRAIGLEEAIENLARIVLRGDRLAREAVGDGAGAREKTDTGVNGHHERRLPAKLFGVLGHDLVERHAVVHLALGIL